MTNKATRRTGSLTPATAVAATNDNARHVANLTDLGNVAPAGYAYFEN